MYANIAVPLVPDLSVPSVDFLSKVPCFLFFVHISFFIKIIFAGLSRTCLRCSHVTHISCWNSLDVTVPICPSGCGCFCTGSDGPFTCPSTPFPSLFSLPSEI